MCSNILTVADIGYPLLQTLLKKYDLTLCEVPEGEAIPGSFWGESEAGLLEDRVYVRDDTPVHSLMHETCHYICMDSQRREGLHTDAGGDYDEENAVCYLQILLADELEAMGQLRMCKDMDRWGYTFRLGSAERWFNEDAEDAADWLESYGLTKAGQPTFRLRDT
jgi:hypothetical protein